MHGGACAENSIPAGWLRPVRTHTQMLTSLLQQTYRDTHEQIVPLVPLLPDGGALVVTTSVCTSVCVCLCVTVTIADAMGELNLVSGTRVSYLPSIWFSLAQVNV